MKAISALLLLLLPLAAGTVTLTWKDQPNCDFHVWVGTTLVKTSKDNTAAIDLPNDRPSTVRVTAFDPAGGYGESVPSEIRLVPVSVFSSTDLRSWQPTLVFYRELVSAMFFKLTPPATTP